MTEKEFLRQVWRPYDSVTVEGGIKGKVLNVCFSTKSVRIRMPEGEPEWFKYDLIIAHNSATAEPDDASIIEKLKEEIEKGKRREEELTNKLNKVSVERNDLQSKLGKNYIEDMSKKLNVIFETIRARQKHLQRVENVCEEISEIINQMENE